VAGRDEIAAWREETGRGYRKAAKHFGMPVGEVLALFGKAPKSRAHPSAGTPAREANRQLIPAPPVRPRDPEKLAAWRAGLDPLPYAQDVQIAIEQSIITVTTGGKFGNGAPYAALLKRAADNRQIVETLAALVPDDLRGAPRDEVLEHIAHECRDWDSAVIEVLFTIYVERHKGRIIFVTESGQHVNWDPDEGRWEKGTAPVAQQSQVAT